MIHAVIQGPARCVSILREWLPEGEDCQLFIDYSPTPSLGCVYQRTGTYLDWSDVKESKELATRIRQSLQHAFGGKQGRSRHASDRDLGNRAHLAVPQPAVLVYLPPEKQYYLERPEGALLAASAIYQGLEHWSLWLRGTDFHKRGYQ